MSAALQVVRGPARRGDWLRLETRDGKPAYAKVAWINARRTVVLLVRHPDRRALSMRTEELRERFAQEGAVPASTSPAEFAAVVKSDLAKLKAIASERGIKAE